MSSIVLWLNLVIRPCTSFTVKIMPFWTSQNFICLLLLLLLKSTHRFFHTCKFCIQLINFIFIVFSNIILLFLLISQFSVNRLKRSFELFVIGLSAFVVQLHLLLLYHVNEVISNTFDSLVRVNHFLVFFGLLLQLQNTISSKCFFQSFAWSFINI